MEHAFGFDIPRALGEVCDSKRITLVVYGVFPAMA
jgi:hypothetical protein